jgi:hypothetical protein
VDAGTTERFPRLIPEYPVWSLRRDPGSTEWSFLDRNATGIPYARVGILLGLSDLGLEAGATVLVPAYHCAAMVVPVVAGGWRAAFYDVGPDFRVDPGLLESALVPGTRAVMAVHYFGFVQDFAPLRDWCQRRGLLLIEDCTHAFYRANDPRGPHPGDHGDLVIASCYKFLPAREGAVYRVRGEAASAPPDLPRATFVEQLKDIYAVIENSWFNRAAGWANPLLGCFVRLRYLGHPSPVVGALAAPRPSTHEELMAVHEPRPRRTTFLSRRIAARAREGAGAEARIGNYRKLAAMLEGASGVVIPALRPGMVPYALPLFSDRIDEVIGRLARENVRYQRFGLPPWMAFDPFPNAARLARTGVQLPIHQSVTPADLDRMARAVDPDRGPRSS